jgi:hypothetical protein
VVGEVAAGNTALCDLGLLWLAFFVLSVVAFFEQIARAVAAGLGDRLMWR